MISSGKSKVDLGKCVGMIFNNNMTTTHIFDMPAKI
jgi:hypothetical protein